LQIAISLIDELTPRPFVFDTLFDKLNPFGSAFAHGLSASFCCS